MYCRLHDLQQLPDKYQNKNLGSSYGDTHSSSSSSLSNKSQNRNLGIRIRKWRSSFFWRLSPPSQQTNRNYKWLDYMSNTWVISVTIQQTTKIETAGPIDTFDLVVLFQWPPNKHQNRNLLTLAYHALRSPSATIQQILKPIRAHWDSHSLSSFTDRPTNNQMETEDVAAE